NLLGEYLVAATYNCTRRIFHQLSCAPVGLELIHLEIQYLCNVACHLLGQTIIKIIYFPVSSIIGHFDLRLSDQEFCMDVSSPSVAHAVVPSVTAEAFMEVLYIVIIIILYIMSALSGCIIPCFAQHSCIFSIAAGFCIHPACIVADIIFVIFTLQFCTVFSEGCRMIIGTDVIERHIMDPVIT